MKTSLDLLSDAYTKIHGQTYYVFTEQELRDYVSLSLHEVLKKV